MIRDDELIERGAEIFRGLGHPSRLFIVSRLGESREMCVGELTEMIGDDVSTVSRHLNVLRTAGIVKSEKRANRVFYRIALPCVFEFLACVAKSLEPKGVGNG